MPLNLEGSCRCGAVGFSVASHTPVPYQLCYCGICRKTAGGGGYAINLMGEMDSLVVRGRNALRIYRAAIVADDGSLQDQLRSAALLRLMRQRLVALG